MSDSAKDRRSQWYVIDRCMTLLLRLMREPASSSELLQTVVDKAYHQEGKRLSVGAAARRFEEDRTRLRTWFECEITYDRATECYLLKSIGRPLIDLPPDALRGLAFLEATFSGDGVPMGSEVRALIEIILMTVPNQRQRELERERVALEVNLQPRDQDEISDEVRDKILQACSEHRQLEFEYLSPKREDGEWRYHRVEPMRYYFDTVRSHYYLEAYRLETITPRGRWHKEEVTAYRLGRIRNPKILPSKFPPGRRVKTVELVYELTPEVARLGVTEHIPGSIITQQEDGCAIIHAPSKNLFFDLRTLLHYGANCRVTGGEEALEAMKKLIEQMYQRYQK